MWLKGNKFIDRNSRSGTYDVNFIYKDDNRNIFISDNHLVAAWAWLHHLDLTENYNFCHIDRHYDLIDNVGEKELLEFKNNPKMEFDDFISKTTSSGLPIFRFDNYILSVKRIFPKLFNKLIFATQEDGYLNIDTETEDVYFPKIWNLQEELSYQINDNTPNKYKWILNLDLDFFYCGGSSILKMMGTEYINQICSEIKDSMDNIAIITIALSPEFCGGWSNAIYMSNRICKRLNIDLKLKLR